MSYRCKYLKIVESKLIKHDPPRGHVVSTTMLVGEDGSIYNYRDLSPGTIFEVPVNADMNMWPWYLAVDSNLSDYYKQHNSHRRPLFIVLPGKDLFLIDGKCWSDGKTYGGWTVSGEIPNITVSPSINIGGFYHGWLQNGVVSDDCEGRVFDSLGYKIK